MALLAALSCLATLLHGAGRALLLATTAVAMALLLRPQLRESRPTRGDLPPVTGRQQAPSAVFVVLDTVRADHLAAYGYERETTPGLDAFARDEATLYADCRATAPSRSPPTPACSPACSPPSATPRGQHQRDAAARRRAHAGGAQDRCPTPGTSGRWTRSASRT